MRFYPGLDPMTWLTAVPLGFVRACMEMIPRLTAEEAIQRSNEVSIGTGSAGEAGTPLVQHWIAAMRQGAAVPSAPVPAPAKMARMGIGVVLVEAKP